jgi:hypothetical protein
MAYLGLVPGERSSGENRRPMSITKSGSIVARKLIVEAAWAYRLPAKVGQAMQRRQEGFAAEVRAIAWRAQLRLCARYRQMLARRKKAPVVITAVARELVGFIWAIGGSVEPRMIAASDTRRPSRRQSGRRRRFRESSGDLGSGHADLREPDRGSPRRTIGMRHPIRE